MEAASEAGSEASLSDDSDVEDGPSDAPASFDDADAEEDVEMSAEKKAEFEQRFNKVREVAAKLAEAPPNCQKEQQEALKEFSESARRAMTLGHALWEKLPVPPTTFVRRAPPPRPRSSQEHGTRPGGRFGQSNPTSWTKKQWKMAAKAAYAYEAGKAAAKIGVPKEERDGLLPDEIHSEKFKREYRYPGQDLEAETQDWEDYQRGKINRDKWLHLTIKDLVDRHGLVEDLNLTLGWSQDWFQEDCREAWTDYKRTGMVSMSAREALRTNKQMYLKKYYSVHPAQHPVFCANPQDWEYTPG